MSADINELDKKLREKTNSSRRVVGGGSHYSLPSFPDCPLTLGQVWFVD
jgi:hypothetical protein